jgi:hypothetical protein
VVYLLLLIFLSVGLWLPRLRGPLDLRYDAGVYYILGTSLAEGKGYRLLNEPGEIEAIQYPPLLPLFAASHQRLAGSTLISVAGQWLRYSFAIIFIGYITVVYLLSRRYLTPDFAFLATLVSLLHVHATWLSDLFFAELPFALISLLFLLLAGGRINWRSNELFAGTLGAAAYLLRSSGIALLAAWVGESLLKRRFRVAVSRGALALLPILAWSAYVTHVKNSEEYLRPAYAYQRTGYQYYNVGYLENVSYVDPFVPELGKASIGFLAKRFARNLGAIPASLGEAVSSRAEWSILGIKRVNQKIFPASLPLWFVDVALSLIGTVVLTGLLLLAFRGEWLIPLYVTGSVVLMCLTPWPGQFERYLAPLTPLLALALFVALVAAGKRLSNMARGKWRSMGAALVVMLVVGVFVQEVVALSVVYTRLHQKAFYKDEAGRRQEYRLFFYSASWEAHDAALDWLKEEAKPGEIVVTSTPHRVYLKTGLSAVMPPFERDVHIAQRLVDSVPGRYVVIDSLDFVDISRRYAAPMVEAFPKLWELIYGTSDNGSHIYRRVDKTGPRGAQESRSSVGNNSLE